ncbi:hypothetical protein [Dactylosporangium sp. NPDC051484]
MTLERAGWAGRPQTRPSGWGAPSPRASRGERLEPVPLADGRCGDRA